MAQTLPPLRAELDFLPSPIAERPGWLLRDPFNYSDQMLVLPPLLAMGLAFFDGEQTLLDLQAHLSYLAGELVPQDVLERMVNALQVNGFLHTEEFATLRAQRHREFAEAPARLPVHAGSGYPDNPRELKFTLNEYLNAGASTNGHALIGLAAPHVSLSGGAACYGAAYGQLRDEAAKHARHKTIVLLGTSHYGQPERFGLTRKPFVTPFGAVEPALELIDWLEENGGDSVVMEDYCHAIEHSLEFQVIFLQQMLGRDFKILPILCGPFAKALLEGEAPERDDNVYRFFDRLGELGDMHKEDLFWVMGVDLAHIGKRYHDDVSARANEGVMLEVAEDDHARLAHVCANESEEFFELVKPEGDRLKWCGFSPLYTFMQVMPQARGHLVKYDQWNIDEESVVSFAALGFTE